MGGSDLLRFAAPALLLLAACQSAPSISAVVDPIVRPAKSEPVMLQSPDDASILERKAIESFRVAMDRDGFNLVESADVASWILSLTVNRDGDERAPDSAGREVRLSAFAFKAADRELPRPPLYWTGKLLANESDYRRMEPFLAYAVLGMYGKDVERQAAVDYPDRWYKIA